MYRGLQRSVAGLTAVLLIAGGSYANAFADESDQAAVKFADTELAKCVSAQAADLTKAELAKVKDLSCVNNAASNHEISDFAGLEALVNLEKLSFAGFDFARPAEDASAEQLLASVLPEFKALQVLKISGANQLPADVIGYPNLKELAFTDGKFTDLPSLTDLPKLAKVDLTGSAIKADQVKLPENVEVIGLSTPASELKNSAAPVIHSTPEVAGADRQANETPADDAVMPDGVLKTCILTYRQMKGKEPTFANTKQLSSLMIDPGCMGSYREFTDWVGAEFLSNITYIRIKNANKISFPKQMASLFPKVSHISSWSSGLNDISGLGTFAQLTRFDLHGGKVTSLPADFSAPKLTHLVLEDEPLTSIDLSGVPDLAAAIFTNTEITSFANVKAPHLKSLDLTGSKISSASAADLAGLTGLETLKLANAQLASFDGSALTNLKQLSLFNNKLSGADAVTAPSVTNLSLGGEAFSQATFTAAQFPELTNLSIVKSSVSKVDVSELLKLKNLTATESKIASVADVKIANVEKLDLNQNKITSFAGIKEKPSLTSVELRYNQIVDGSELANIKNVEIMAFSQDISGLTVEAGAENEISSIFKLPTGATVNNLTLSANGAKQPNMPVLSADNTRFMAASFGDWRISFDVDRSLLPANSYWNGYIHGTAAGGQEVKVEILGKTEITELIAETYTAKLTNLSANSYQWVLGKAPIADATGNSYDFKAVAKDNGKKLMVKVTNDFGTFESSPVTLQVFLNYVDQGMRNCFEQRYGKQITVNDVTKYSQELICPSYGIKDLADLARFGLSFQKIDLSGNEIQDISGITTGSGLRGKYINLANNKIKDISRLAALKYANYKSMNLLAEIPTGIDLSGNQIADISPLNKIKVSKLPAADSEAVAIRVADQRVALAQIAVNQRIAQPKVTDFAGENTALEAPGMATDNGEVWFDAQGVKSFAWSKPRYHGIEFSGEYLLQVGDVQPAMQLNLAQVTGREPVVAKLSGFGSGEAIKITWEDGSQAGQTVADEGGFAQVQIIATPDAADRELIATGASGKKASAKLKILQAAFVEMPDPQLRKCVFEKALLPPESKAYLRELNKITGSLECQRFGIKDITGISALAGVTNLVLSGNHISDFRPLQPMLQRGIVVTAMAQSVSAEPQFTHEPGQLPVSYAPDGSKLTMSIPVDYRKFPAEQGGNYEVVALPNSDWVNTDTGLINWPAAGEYRFGFYLDYKDKATNASIKLGGTHDFNVFESHGLGVFVAPHEVFPGQLINIVATGMKSGEKVLFTLHSSPTVLGIAQANKAGVARLNDVLIAADVSIGEHLIKAEGTKSDRQAETKLIVKAVPSPIAEQPRLLISSSVFIVGEPFKLMARGMTPGEEVSFSLHSEPVLLGKAIADSNGVAVLNDVRLDASVKPGQHEIWAVGSISGKQRTLKTKVLVRAGNVQTGRFNMPRTGSDSLPGIPAALFVATLGLALVSRRLKENAR